MMPSGRGQFGFQLPEEYAVMSRQALEAVIGRVVIDEEFRLMLFADPEAALTGYELAEREIAALRTIDAESLDVFARGVGRRIVRALEATEPP
jgi:hypothetical protein